MSSQNTSHPLPAPPGQQNAQNTSNQHYPPHVQYQQQLPQSHQPYSYQQQPQRPQATTQQSQPGQQKQRPRSRGFSFRSDRSHKSSGSNGHHPKVDLHETAAEKEAKRLHTKADPSVAMNEAEPAAVQAQTKTQLAPLRGIQHKDAFGNPIADPDRSNPTRSRWERPLDTIRSFEAAIDGGYNRKSYVRSDSDSPVNWNKRSSTYGSELAHHPRSGGSADMLKLANGGVGASAARFPQDSHYGGRPQSTSRLESMHDTRPAPGVQRDSYYADGPQGGYNNGYSPGPNGADRRRYPRVASEPHFNPPRQQQDPNIYPIPNNHRSYETVASASGSGTSGEAPGYQTDLTSDNSSAERVQAPQRRRQEQMNDYGPGYNQNAGYPSSSFTVGVKSPMNLNSQPTSGYQNDGSANYGAPAPPAPPKGGLLRKQSTQTSQPPSAAEQRPAAGDKRKSWFTRKFSKS